MINPTTVSMIRDIVAIFGVIAGFTYYVLNVKANQKNQEHAEETRKIQLVHDINESASEGEGNLNWVEMIEMEWTNYDDFVSKYGSANNPDLYIGRLRIWRRMNFSGLLLRDGLIDISTYIQVIGDNPPVIWSKFRSIIEEMRVRFDNPELYCGIEILAEEVDRYRVSKGLKPKGPTP